MNRLGIKVLLWCALPALTGRAQSDTTLTYRVEASANVSSEIMHRCGLRPIGTVEAETEQCLFACGAYLS